MKLPRFLLKASIYLLRVGLAELMVFRSSMVSFLALLLVRVVPDIISSFNVVRSQR